MKFLSRRLLLTVLAYSGFLITGASTEALAVVLAYLGVRAYTDRKEP